MSQENPDDVPPGYTIEEFSDLVRVLAGEGWLIGNQFVNADKISINYSEKGVQRMNALAGALKEIAPELFGGSSSIPKAFRTPMFVIKAIGISPELIGKIKTEGQGNALTALIGAYAKSHGDNSPGHDSSEGSQNPRF